MANENPGFNIRVGADPTSTLLLIGAVAGGGFLLYQAVKGVFGGEGTEYYTVTGLSVSPRLSSGSPWITNNDFIVGEEITLDIAYTIARNAKPGLFRDWSTFVKVTDTDNNMVLFNNPVKSFGEENDPTQSISVAIPIGHYDTAGTAHLKVEVGGDDNITKATRTVSLTIESGGNPPPGQTTFNVSIKQPTLSPLPGYLALWPSDIGAFPTPHDASAVYNYLDTAYVKGVGSGFGPLQFRVIAWIYNGYRFPVDFSRGEYEVTTPIRIFGGKTTGGVTLHITTHETAISNAGVIQWRVSEDAAIDAEFSILQSDQSEYQLFIAWFIRTYNFDPTQGYGITQDNYKTVLHHGTVTFYSEFLAAGGA